MKRFRLRFTIVLAVMIILVGARLLPPSQVTNAQSGPYPIFMPYVIQASPGSLLAALPITFPVQSPELIEYFNNMAQPEDLASIPEPYLQLLPQVKEGQGMVGFASWAAAEATIPTITTPMNWVLYNPEHWDNTPIEEQNDLPGTVQSAAEFLHARGMKLFLVPDRRFVDESLAEFAAYADALMLQGQRIQSDTFQFKTWMTAQIDIARTANPDIKIYIQVGANQGPAEEMYSAVESIASQIDGIAVWSQPALIKTLQEFVEMVRPTTAQTPPDGTITASPAIEPAQPTSTIQTNTAESAVTSAATSPQPAVSATAIPSTGTEPASTGSGPLICGSVILLLGLAAGTGAVYWNRRHSLSS